MVSGPESERRASCYSPPPQPRDVQGQTGSLLLSSGQLAELLSHSRGMCLLSTLTCLRTVLDQDGKLWGPYGDEGDGKCDPYKQIPLCLASRRALRDVTPPNHNIPRRRMSYTLL